MLVSKNMLSHCDKKYSMNIFNVHNIKLSNYDKKYSSNIFNVRNSIQLKPKQLTNKYKFSTCNNKDAELSSQYNKEYNTQFKQFTQLTNTKNPKKIFLDNFVYPVLTTTMHGIGIFFYFCLGIYVIIPMIVVIFSSCYDTYYHFNCGSDCRKCENKKIK